MDQRQAEELWASIMGEAAAGGGFNRFRPFRRHDGPRTTPFPHARLSEIELQNRPGVMISTSPVGLIECSARERPRPRPSTALARR